MSSLGDQLLKAGLVSKDKVTKANSAKRKQAKQNRKHKLNQVDESKLLAEKERQQHAERARQLNKEKNAKAEQVAIVAQIKQLITSHAQSAGKPQVTFNFSDDGIIKKLEVSHDIQRFLINGRLSIARLGEEYFILPKNVAEKIMQRSEDYIVRLQVEDAAIEEDDPYADYQIPDDLMW